MHEAAQVGIVLDDQYINELLISQGFSRENGRSLRPWKCGNVAKNTSNIATCSAGPFSC
jgi:hypothetical protein